MPRERSENRDKAFEIYKKRNGDITNREIANILGEDEKKIAVWKQRDNWNTNVVQQKKECCTTFKNNSIDKKEDSKILSLLEENSNNKLTDKQRLFVAEYLKDFNTTRAALAAGYSKSTAHDRGYEILRNKSVQQEVKRQTEVLFDSIGLTSQRILMEYMKIAGADINDYLTFGNRTIVERDKKTGEPILDKEGNPIEYTYNYVDFKESSQVDTSLIQEVKVGKDGASIKLYDKMKAMEMLAKYMKLITNDTNINVQQNNLFVNEIQNLTEDEINKRIEALECEEKNE